jgi:hypothetical protein
MPKKAKQNKSNEAKKAKVVEETAMELDSPRGSQVEDTPSSDPIESPAREEQEAEVDETGSPVQALPTASRKRGRKRKSKSQMLRRMPADMSWADEVEEEEADARKVEEIKRVKLEKAKARRAKQKENKRVAKAASQDPDSPSDTQVPKEKQKGKASGKDKVTLTPAKNEKMLICAGET